MRTPASSREGVSSSGAVSSGGLPTLSAPPLPMAPDAAPIAPPPSAPPPSAPIAAPAMAPSGPAIAPAAAPAAAPAHSRSGSGVRRSHLRMPGIVGRLRRRFRDGRKSLVTVRIGAGGVGVSVAHRAILHRNWASRECGPCGGVPVRRPSRNPPAPRVRVLQSSATSRRLRSRLSAACRPSTNTRRPSSGRHVTRIQWSPAGMRSA